MTPEEEQKFVYEHLIKTFEMAGHDALLEIVLRIAESAGITSIEDLPVRDFYEKRKYEISEDLVRDYADTNPSMASKVKEIWDILNQDKL